MEVEAGHHHHAFFPPQIMMTNGAIDNQMYGIGNPLSATATAMYCSGFSDPMIAFPSNAHPLKAESGLTTSFPVSRKRARDCSDMNALFSFQNVNQNPIGGCETETYTFLGEDVTLQIHQQQLEMDQFVAYHTEKVRLDVEERRNRNSSRIIAAAVEETISKRLRAKEEEIVKISKLNWALEQKVKSLCVENQIWRELAQTNEATANALRSNLKQLLEQQQMVDDEYRHRSTTACVDEDAQSCCESNDEEKQRLIIDEENVNGDCSSSGNNKRLCRKCGYGESCVLLLPCRHLCLCTVCASYVDTCPVCKSTKNMSVHVNMSS